VGEVHIGGGKKKLQKRDSTPSSGEGDKTGPRPRKIVTGKKKRGEERDARKRTPKGKGRGLFLCRDHPPCRGKR